MFRALIVGVVAAVAALPTAVFAASVGVCYSPIHHGSDFATNPNATEALLHKDLQQIAAQGFSYVRTYHSFYNGINVVDVAQKYGLQVAVGVQMLSASGGEYAELEQDIHGAIWVAQSAPASVLAIYVGNENLLASSADKIVEIVTRIKTALKGTGGENVPVGTVQRAEEWLTDNESVARLAEVSDVVGANVYPFYSHGSQLDMKTALSAQWKAVTDKYGAKARLTETGWSSQSEFAPAGNVASLTHAEDYFAAFVSWSIDSAAVTPFYFSMYDWANAPGNDYAQHFGLADGDGEMKFALLLTNTELREGEGSSSSIDQNTDNSQDVELPEPTPELTLEPLPTLEPTVEPTLEPTPEPTSDSSASSSGSGSEDIVEPTSRVPSDGVVPAPTRAPASSAAPVPAPADNTTKSPEQQAAEEAAAREASSRQARTVSGGTGGGFFIFGSAAVVLGVAAIAVIAVYMKRQVRQNADEGETRTVAASSIDPRASTPTSVYDDPLGTRFSSIVMITPNGDGVCIL